MWCNYICYRYIINKKNKSRNDKKGQYYIAANVTSTALVKFYSKKSKRFPYFVCSFIINHITIGNYYYLLSLPETRRYNKKWKIINFKKLVIKIVRVHYIITWEDFDLDTIFIDKKNFMKIFWFMTYIFFLTISQKSNYRTTTDFA